MPPAQKGKSDERLGSAARAATRPRRHGWPLAVSLTPGQTADIAAVEPTIALVGTARARCYQSDGSEAISPFAATTL
jgi:hypothetical protein